MTEKKGKAIQSRFDNPRLEQLKKIRILKLEDCGEYPNESDVIRDAFDYFVREKYPQLSY